MVTNLHEKEKPEIPALVAEKAPAGWLMALALLLATDFYF
jgi:hypothetical protein